MIAKFFIDRPIFAWVIAIIILLSGVLALRNLPVASYPAVAPPALAITLNYPGASAQVVEETAVALVEQELNGIENLLYMESSSEQGIGTITLTFAAGTNLDVASVETQNRVKRAEARLPEEVRRVGVTVVKSARNFLMIVALISPDKSRDNVALGSYAAANVLESIRRVPGVGEAMMFGTEYSMRLWLKPEKLHAYNLTPGDVSRAVRAQNTQLVTGELGQLPAAPGQELNAVIVTKSRLSSTKEFGNVIVRANPDGSTVRVKDVARVELGAQDYSITARIDGQPASAIAIRLSPSANALDTAKAVKARMEELSKFFPKGVDWLVPYDTSKFVEISISEVVQTLAEAMVLVFLVIWLFLGNLRATFIPAIVVPVALIGAVVGLYAVGYSINTLTLFAMVLAVGIVVDDAIVVVENVERIMTEENLSPREATRKAMGQIFGAIIAITLVLCSVFVPMMFFGGAVGAIYKQFAVTLILTILFSLLMALTLTPALCAALLRNDAGHEMMPKSGFLGWFNRLFNRTTQHYKTGVTNVVKRTGRYMLVYAALLAGMGWLFLHLPSSFLPEEDQGYFINLVQLPAGATRERSQEVLSQVEQFYLKQPEVDHVIGVLGFSFFGRGQNAAIAFVRLKDWDERPGKDSSAPALVNKANMALFRIKQAFIFAINVPPIPELAAVGGFDFRLQDRSGQGREKLMEARNMALGIARQASRAGRRASGRTGARAATDAQHRPPESARARHRHCRPQRDAAIHARRRLHQRLRARGPHPARADAGRSGRAHRRRNGFCASRCATRRAAWCRCPRSPRRSWSVGLPKLDRYNGLPSVKLAGSPAPGRSTGDALLAMEEVAAQLPPGFGFEWSGTSSEERSSGVQAPFLFGLSLVAVFLCLAALYESWTVPVAVIMVVPIGILGALAAVTMRGLPNDVYFKVGLIVIIGLSAKNAILIIQFARELQHNGHELVEATLEACRLRFRPILMTSIAFILGVLPLAISTGAGANGRHAIGTGVMGGMIAATVIAVFLIPVFYVVISRLFPTKPAIPQEQDHE